MTDAEIQTRVDAWIESRELSGEAAALADQWLDVSGRYGPQSAPALGVLVALVREAWRWQVYPVCLGDDGWHVVCPKFGPEREGRPLLDDVHVWGATEDEACVAALEAAPC